MIFGLSSYSFPWAIGLGDRPPRQPMDVFALLEEAKRLKAGRLQIADNLPVDRLAPSEWQKLLKKAGDYDIGLELGIRGLLIPQLERYLALSQDCGAPFLRVVIDRNDFEPDHDEIAATIREVLPAFRQAGVVLAIENHDRFRAEEFVRIIEATDPQWVGICLDTANSIGAGEGLHQVAETLAPYTINLHYKDYRTRRPDHQMGFIVSGVPAGAGQIPHRWLFDLMRRKSRCESVTLEVWLDPLEDLQATVQKEVQWVEQGAAFLRQALNLTNP